MAEKFIVRSSLLSAAHQITGYELACYSGASGEGMAGDEELSELVAAVNRQLVDEDGNWQLGEMSVLLEATPALLSSAGIGALPAEKIILRLSHADLVDADVQAQVLALRQRGFGICLCNADAWSVEMPLSPAVSHAEGEFTKQDGKADVLLAAGIQPLVRPVRDWAAYEVATAMGLAVLPGNLYLTPHQQERKALNPAQLIIIQLMDMVRNNADVRHLEDVLKRDAALSYKLLRYINSASFGLGVEVQSLRHAVTILGYSPLYRWLTLLLASASDNSDSIVLTQMAIVRGRIAELIGQASLPRGEADNLFVVGMFSLLDRLLGMPMAEVLSNIHLSEPISRALLSREGIYGPFLSLVEACESGNGKLAAIADALFLSQRQVNDAHLAALAWAQKIKL
ncbi:HDOD domain-containing protein [uncultured Oxalicibacterium sp.]|uniref:EAL and HDOD domain-containing protein n=1 Tax=uncultured Oxalicibacterium sp. TaxID=1168540 RepID=UPI0025FBEB22|nr:HDOD domain-containing protein [uncultured Oxalicibacterium sp.]